MQLTAYEKRLKGALLTVIADKGPLRALHVISDTLNTVEPTDDPFANDVLRVTVNKAVNALSDYNTQNPAYPLTRGA